MTGLAHLWCRCLSLHFIGYYRIKNRNATNVSTDVPSHSNHKFVHVKMERNLIIESKIKLLFPSEADPLNE